LEAAVQAIKLVTALVSVVAALAVANPVSASATNTGPSTEGVIVWSNRATDGSEHLLIARADGSHQRDLTTPAPDTRDADAQISPNGRWIAYQHNQGETDTIHLVRPNGRDDHLVDVGCMDPCVAAASPTWLSNSRIAFTLVSGPFDEETGVPASVALYTARIDGSHVRRLSEPSIDGVYEDVYLRVAPDHRYLTFLRRRIADETSALFRVAPNGSHLRQLTPWNLGINVNDLSTARRGPTKDLLIFDGSRDTSNTFIDLGTVPTTCRSLSDCTSKIRWLTDNSATGRRNANPQWSPNGTSLVFTDRANAGDTNAEIWTMRYPESTRSKISTSPNFDYRPTWGRLRTHRR
jgi:dipeptidyl aminopeptidase/acylaminoacyl peptidase